MSENHIEPVGTFQRVQYSQFDDLTWFQHSGYGYYHIRKPAPYDEAYFEKYRGYARTDLGAKITKLRVDLVNSYVPKGMPLVDIGIGCGQFIDEMSHWRRTYGYDVNPVAIVWLNNRDIFARPEAYPYCEKCLTFWDSFEHIDNLNDIMAIRAKFICMSLPVFRDAAHVVNSKHYRKDEHYWYFTIWGLIRAMDENGYQLVEYNDDETRAGREDIGTFVFIRR